MTDGFDEHELGEDIEEEPNSVFSSLLNYYEGCSVCDYEGPLTLRKKGYTCPQCKTLVLPME